MSDPVRVERVAHGGTCITHLAGKVTFVAGALPGELVELRITDSRAKANWAVAERVVVASEHRVFPECPVAEICGGCDWLHTTPAYARELKAQVLADQLRRLAGIEWDGSVREVLPISGWRTRMRYHEGRFDEVGLFVKGSRDVVPLPPMGCLAADPAISRPVRGSVAVAAASGAVWRSDVQITERALGREWRLDSSTFWQVHPKAPEVLAEAVLTFLEPKPGERAWDLFCGVGLFAGALTNAGCSVIGVEGNRAAVAYARRNVPEARFFSGDVAHRISQLTKPDLVVLDPPRAGANRAVMQEICAARPRAIAYVSCDPATLARDLNYAQQVDYQVVEVQAFDLFPGTHHVETVVLMSRVEGK